PLPKSTLFPYTTLFRSKIVEDLVEVVDAREQLVGQPCGYRRIQGNRIILHVNRRALVVPKQIRAYWRHLVSLPGKPMRGDRVLIDRKSTRLNSSHVSIS